MVRQVNSGPCPLCRRPLDWDRLVETMRHCRANGLDVATADAEEVPYNLRSNAAVAARAGALGEAGHVASALALPAPALARTVAGLALTASALTACLRSRCAVTNERGGRPDAGRRRGRRQPFRLPGHAGVDKKSKRGRPSARRAGRGERAPGRAWGAAPAASPSQDDSFEALL